jgi:hypothetical protein
VSTALIVTDNILFAIGAALTYFKPLRGEEEEEEE